MSTLDWTIAQALAGHQIIGELESQRAAVEPPVAAAWDSMRQKCHEVQSLAMTLEGGAEPCTQGGVDVQGVLASAGMLLPGKHKELHEAEQALEAYRLRHGLTRLPRAPHVVLNVLILAIMVLAEALVNGSFFLNANMVAGPFAALLLSALIAATNVTVSATAGFHIGRFLRYGANAVDADAPEFVHRRERARQHLYAYLLAIGLFHGTVGLVRAQETLDAVHTRRRPIRRSSPPRRPCFSCSSPSA
jgi:hypothetical protein